ncbi:class I SAM-dependent methyltransferase [Luteimonas mephitis]|uniref:class I SAM-dependent methyltransferase n=1 Tax=Luteimonas mephitis TaxID=83615 RepID=UPI003A8F131E
MHNGIELHAPKVQHDDGYDPAYFTDLARLEDRHFWFIQRNRIIGAFARRFFPETTRYMEVGCGTGFVLHGLQQAFPHWRVWGSELHAEGLEFAGQRLPDARFLQMDARRIPFKDEFDLIGSFDVLEHIPEDEAVLGSMHSALRPGGGLLLTVPQHPRLWSAQDVAAHHVRRYRRGELEAKLERAGFSVVRSTSFVTLLLPMMLASRMGSRLAGDACDPLREVRIGPLANLLGNFGMWFDRVLIAVGINLPVGGSRIIAARRTR